MNSILVVTLIILIAFAVIGWMKGIVKMVISMVGLVACIFATAILSPMVSSYVKENTKVYEGIQKNIYGFINDNEQINNAVGEAVADKAEEEITDVQSPAYQEQINKYIQEVNEKINLSNKYKDTVSSIIQDEYYAGVIKQADNFKDAVSISISIQLANIIFQALIYILLFIVLFILLKIVIMFTGVLTAIPIIHGTNKILGLVLGIVEGLFAIWILYTVITAASGATQYASQALININENVITRFIYNMNPILNVIIK